jgi:hypothetical protein
MQFAVLCLMVSVSKPCVGLSEVSFGSDRAPCTDFEVLGTLEATRLGRDAVKSPATPTRACGGRSMFTMEPVTVSTRTNEEVESELEARLTIDHLARARQETWLSASEIH